MKLNMLEIRRQLLHILIGTIILFLLIIDLMQPLHLFILIVIGVVLSIISRFIKVPFINWFLNNFERDKDRKKFPGRGFIAMLVGILITIKLFEPSIAYASIMILVLGDSISHMFGTHVGRTRHPLNEYKSLEGNIMGSFAGAIGAVFFVDPFLATIGAFGAMAIEAIQVKMNNSIIDDNIIVPLAAGAIMLLLKTFLF